MKTEEFQRAVRALTQITPNDTAVVVAIRRANGQFVTVNTGDQEAREEIYKLLRVVPCSAPSISTTITKEEEQ